MKSRITAVIGIIVSMVFLAAAGASAEENIANANENVSKFSLGIGTYALIVTNPSPYDDFEFSGGSVVLKGAINKHFAVRGAFYSLEDDDISMLDAVGVELDVTGFDLQILAGTNFYKGFNAFAGVGLFNENWEASKTQSGITVSYDENFSGAQLSFGLGYNWKKVGLEYIVNIRDTSDYEDFTGIEHDAAVSGSLALSYRF